MNNFNYNIIGSLTGTGYTQKEMLINQSGIVELLHCIGCKDVGTRHLGDTGFSSTGKLGKGKFLRITVLDTSSTSNDVILRLRTKYYNCNKFVTPEYLLMANFRIRPFEPIDHLCANGSDGSVVIFKLNGKNVEDNRYCIFETLHEDNFDLWRTN